MPTLKQTLSYLIRGQKGGKKRVQIIDLLNDRPYNLHQMAEILKVNYRTVKHHIDVLVKNGLVSSSKTGGYGDVYFLTPEMESNMALFNSIVKGLPDSTSSPGFFQNILQQTNDSVIIFDDKNEVIFWNDASMQIYGYEDDEVIGKPINIFKDDGVREDLIRQVLGGERIVAFETQLKHKSGEPIDVSLTMDSIKDENDDLVGFSIVTRDVSERKREERKLKESEEKYRSLFESSPDNVYVLDMKGTIVDVNPKTLERLGYKKEDIVGRPLPEIFSPDSQKVFTEKFPILLEKGINNAVVELVTKTGDIKVVDCLASVVRNNRGEIENILVFERDITERVRETEKLKESEEKYRTFVDSCCPGEADDNDKGCGPDQGSGCESKKDADQDKRNKQRK